MKEFYDFLGDFSIKDLSKITDRILQNRYSFDKSRLIEVFEKFNNRSELTLIEIDILQNILYLSNNNTIRDKIIEFLYLHPIESDKIVIYDFSSELVYNYNLTLEQCESQTENFTKKYLTKNLLINLIKVKNVDLLESIIKKYQNDNVIIDLFESISIDFTDDIEKYRMSSRIITKIIITRCGGNVNRDMGEMYRRVLYLFCPKDSLYMIFGLTGAETIIRRATESSDINQIIKFMKKRILQGFKLERSAIIYLLENYKNMISIKMYNSILRYYVNDEILDLITNQLYIKLSFNEMLDILKGSRILKIENDDNDDYHYILLDKNK